MPTGQHRDSSHRVTFEKTFFPEFLGQKPTFGFDEISKKS